MPKTVAKTKTAVKTAPKAAPHKAKPIEGKSARKNATTPAVRDAITEVKSDGGEIAYVMAGKEKIALPAHKLRGELLALATVGASLSVLREALGAHKPKLATGVDSRNSPQSAKSVADKNKAAPKAKAEYKAPAKTKAETKGVKNGKMLAYKTGPKSNDARVGSWRYYMLAVIQSVGTREEAEALHASGKHANFSKEFAGKKLDVRWALAEGYVTAK